MSTYHGWLYTLHLPRYIYNQLMILCMNINKLWSFLSRVLYYSQYKIIKNTINTTYLCTFLHASTLGVLFVLLISIVSWIFAFLICLFLDMSAWLVGSSDSLYLISTFLFSPNFQIATKVGFSH